MGEVSRYKNGQRVELDGRQFLRAKSAMHFSHARAVQRAGVTRGEESYRCEGSNSELRTWVSGGKSAKSQLASTLQVGAELPWAFTGAACSSWRGDDLYSEGCLTCTAATQRSSKPSSGTRGQRRCRRRAGSWQSASPAAAAQESRSQSKLGGGVQNRTRPCTVHAVTAVPGGMGHLSALLPRLRFTFEGCLPRRCSCWSAACCLK